MKSRILRIILVLIGLYYTLEAAANLFYWETSGQPLLFQLGRAARLILGLVLIGLACIVKNPTLNEIWERALLHG